MLWDYSMILFQEDYKYTKKVTQFPKMVITPDVYQKAWKMYLWAIIISFMVMTKILLV